jgi:hypothetical protein
LKHFRAGRDIARQSGGGKCVLPSGRILAADGRFRE